MIFSFLNFILIEIFFYYIIFIFLYLLTIFQIRFVDLALKILNNSNYQTLILIII